MMRIEWGSSYLDFEDIELRLSKEVFDGYGNLLDHESKLILGDIVWWGDDNMVSFYTVVGASAWIYAHLIFWHHGCRCVSIGRK